MALPAGSGVRAVGAAAGPRDGALQPAKEGQGESGAGLTVSGVSEVQAAEALDRADGGVAVEDLSQEEVSGDDRGEGPSAPGVTQLAADGVQECLGHDFRQVALDAREGLGDSEPRDLLRVMVLVQPHHLRRSFRFLGQPKVNPAKHLRLHLMPFVPASFSLYRFPLGENVN